MIFYSLYVLLHVLHEGPITLLRGVGRWGGRKFEKQCSSLEGGELIVIESAGLDRKGP